MIIGETIYKLRTDSGLSQESFAEIFHVSQQSVQKWETGESVPELNRIISISKYFGVSLDALITSNNNRSIEEMERAKTIKPQYQNIPDWQFYPSALSTEYRQCCEEGLEIEQYKDLFEAVSRLTKSEAKKKLGDVIFDIVSNAGYKKDYPYHEPSGLDEIALLQKPYEYRKLSNPGKNKVHGAWMGRICGCMLGKTIEGIKSEELVRFLKETDNFPMHRYIVSDDITKETIEKYNFGFKHCITVDKITGMPVDDDTNYTVLAQQIISKYGYDFTPLDVSRAWTSSQPMEAYCTAERVAYCNFVKGYKPPQSAVYKNPYREWIGAQIRGDYFGYINPGNPHAAAEMAWKDASISHIKNGIYGEMFVAAMIAVAAETNNIRDIILSGLSVIPHTSRLYEAITRLITDFDAGISQKNCFLGIHKRFDDHSAHDWCHTIPNAEIVVASLLYGSGDYGKSICMAVETGFDTDCNGATVGSILGMANGIETIDDKWTKPIGNLLNTSICSVGAVKISDLVEKTMQHIRKEPEPA